MPSLPKRKRKPQPWGQNRDRKIYDSARWKRVREMQLYDDPLCIECLNDDIIREATVVDHIIPIREGGDIWNLNNLQSLCKQCHNKKTAKESNQ